MDKCASCEYAVFDEIFGEYKCKVRQMRVYKPSTNMCEWYKKGIPTKSKDDGSREICL